MACKMWLNVRIVLQLDSVLQSEGSVELEYFTITCLDAECQGTHEIQIFVVRMPYPSEFSIQHGDLYLLNCCDLPLQRAFEKS